MERLILRKFYYPQFNFAGIVLIGVFLVVGIFMFVNGDYFGGLFLFVFCLLAFSHRGMIVRRYSFVKYYSVCGIKFKDVQEIKEILKITIVRRTYQEVRRRTVKDVVDFAIILRTSKTSTIEASVGKSYEGVLQDARVLSKIFQIEYTDLVKKGG